jgi:hypothetical protein
MFILNKYQAPKPEYNDGFGKQVSRDQVSFLSKLYEKIVEDKKEQVKLDMEKRQRYMD